ncbi:hypothetical protein JIG36_13390 [Actinoplanes sp. LDG1-06]|uniref:DUF4239 domain-containing protein n=1 Tax=Paractinoplanes ovalisporus TaxID=2810368 RepID=A0ABS2A9P6_9ACTN|nr:hypothetical protein [Actinoplanes ovalisporus]MBM2616552.1 hypothetical protein [Actinoplanes ovalisporus]
MAQRTLPVRDDRWQPEDRIYDGLIARAVDHSEDSEARDGTAEMMAGALILVVLFLVIMKGAESATAALVTCGVLGGAGFLWMVMNARPAKADRAQALKELGGPGSLPAGYLVHAKAWDAGLSDHVAGVPESQLLAAAELCNIFPGTVNDLLRFVENVAVHVPTGRHTSADDVRRRARELVHVAKPIVVDYAKSAPKLPTPPPEGKKGKK